jgi:hypothetical protein
MSRYTHAKMNVCYFLINTQIWKHVPFCKKSRWKVVEKNADDNCSAVGATSVKKLLPVKILRYFPLIPRLQRMYMSKQVSKDM